MTAYKVFESIIVPVISVLAFVMSLITLWQTFFSPFSAQTSMSSMMWKMEELQQRPDAPRVRSLVMVAEVQSVNQGAKPGRSDPFQIVLERKQDMRRWTFQPAVFISYGEFIRQLGQTAERRERERIVERVLEGPFAAPFLQGKQSLGKAIVFAPPSGFPFPMGELKQGDYVIRFGTIRKGEFREVEHTSFSLTSDDLEVISDGKGWVVPIR